MKKIIAVSCAMCVIAISIFQQCSPGPDENNTVNDSLPPVTAPDSWFAADTTPAPDDYGDFLNPNVNDTSFHVWAWQKFLSLTRSGNGVAPFEGLQQVDNEMNHRGKTILLTDTSQAGSGGTLYDKQNRQVMYTIHVNHRMDSFQNAMLPQFLDIFAQYKGQPKRDSLVQAALAANGLDKITYPVGSIEIKTAWMLSSSLGKDSSDYYLTTAIVKLGEDSSFNRVALIGMHIIGIVANHPEFIWATYEHNNLAPDFPWAAQTPQDTLNTIPSEKDFVFYNGNTKVKDCPMNNAKDSPAVFTNVFNMFPLGIARSFTSDSIPSYRDSTNNVNTASLNKSVFAQLEKLSGPWKNYFYKGSVWLNAADASFGPGQGYIGNLSNFALRGSRNISNITMETFRQLDYGNNYKWGPMNCFGCHATADYTNVVGNNDSLSYNLALSHLFKNALGHRSIGEVHP